MQSDVTPWWRRNTTIVVGLVLLVAVLLGGSLYTSRGGLFGHKSTTGSARLQVKTGDPNRLASRGEKLLMVTNPPNLTRRDIHLTKDLGKPTFLIEFQPYGLAQNRTAVIRIKSAKAQGGNQLAQGFAQALTGQNMQVTVDVGSVSALASGGSYSGEIRLVDRDGTDSFALSAVKHAD
jgi:hypothetical protein